MLTAVLIGIIALLTIALGFAVFYLWKFAKIIMVFEDDISDTLDALGSVENAIIGILQMQLFFESPEVKKAVQNVLDEVKICRSVVNQMIQKFTARSKQKYVLVRETDSFEQQLIPRLPGQPPGTPNPLEALQSEGMLLDVRHHERQR